MGLQCFVQADLDKDYDTHVITGFDLVIGNNYTAHHFIKFLFEQRYDVVEFVRKQGIGIGDDVIFEYKGSYGDHTEHWAMSDLADFFRAQEKVMDWEDQP
jgi:hypothetical protein